jgi:hypothetical protein
MFGGNSMALTTACALCAVLFSVVQVSGAEDVDSILRQIKSESTRRAVSEPTPQAATVKKTSRPQSSKPKPRQPPARQPEPETFSGPIWGPKDKLPKQIRGHGLAGDFVIAGQFDGCVELLAAEDNTNPFPRRFIIANKHLDLPDYHFIPFDQREILTIPRSNPLIFLEKTSLAYYYVHMH